MDGGLYNDPQDSQDHYHTKCGCRLQLQEMWKWLRLSSASHAVLQEGKCVLNCKLLSGQTHTVICWLPHADVQTSDYIACQEEMSLVRQEPSNLQWRARTLGVNKFVLYPAKWIANHQLDECDRGYRY